MARECRVLDGEHQKLYGGVQAGGLGLGAAGQPQAAGQHREGVHRTGQGRARHHPLRVLGQRQLAAPDGRHVRVNDWRKAGARTLQRQQRCRHRPGGGRGGKQFCGCAQRAGAGALGPAARAGRNHRQTHSAATRCAHHARGRRAGLRSLGLAGTAGTGWHRLAHRATSSCA